MIVMVWERNSPRKCASFEVSSFEEVRSIVEAHRDRDVTVSEKEDDWENDITDLPW